MLTLKTFTNFSVHKNIDKYFDVCMDLEGNVQLSFLVGKIDM